MSFSILCRKPFLNGALLNVHHSHRLRFISPQKLFFPIKRTSRQFVELAKFQTVPSTSNIATSEMETANVSVVARLDAFRKEMEKAKVSAYIVPTSDPHLLEQPPNRFRRRAFISGFNGSAGTAVITEDKAALWTDGRYFLQAENQLSSEWQLMKQGTADCPQIGDWLASVLDPGSRVGIDAFCHPESEVVSLNAQLKKNAIEVLGTDENLVDIVWAENIPKDDIHQLRIHPIEFAGETVQSKFTRIREEMKKNDASALLVSKVEEIGWTLNLRGADEPYSPIFISYLIIAMDSAELYVENAKVTNEVESYLKELGVHLRPYSEILTGVKAAMKNNASKKMWLNPSLCSHAVFKTAYGAVDAEKSADKILSQGTPLTLFMAVKNSTELDGMREAHIRDAEALIEFLAWFEEQISSGKILTEVEVDRELTLRRSQRPGFKGLSFPTIAGANGNGSIIHYSATEQDCSKVDKNTLLLIDSGGQYDCGTTDITRTFHLGMPSDYQKLCFTKVLQGHIGMATAKVPMDTPGMILDAFARRPLWSLGLDYRHGTGHGVGAHMCCHEGPISISFRYTSPMAQHPLKENMIVSNEPGYYEDGNFGIRIENLCIIRKEETKYQFGGMSYIGFETISFVPIQSKMISISDLTQDEIHWVDTYHQQVWDKLNDRVSPKAKQWLKDNTQPLK